MNTCEKVREQLSLLLYGELSFDEEETVDGHLESCAECRTALERERFRYFPDSPWMCWGLFADI